MKLKNRDLIIAGIFLLFLIAFLTVPHGLLDATDVKDYSDTAKFFAGEYSAKHRSAHSVLYGLFLSPLVNLTDSFFFLKFASAFWLALLILSVYYIGGKKKEILWLILLCPLIWFMAPWLSPVPLVALIFLWAWFFIKKFESDEKIKYLIFSGLLLGLSTAIWESALYFSFIFLISFLYNKKLYYSIAFLIALFVGVLPLLIVNQMVFGFAFYSFVKHTSAVFVCLLQGVGIYGQDVCSGGTLKLILTILFIPFFIYLFYQNKVFRKYKKTVIFLTISFLFILTNPQTRLVLAIVPIVILVLGNVMNKKQLKIQLIIFAFLSLLVFVPYLIQIKYDTNAKYFTPMVENIANLEVYERQGDLIAEDLNEIGKEYKGESFIVGNNNDNYRTLAHFYWEDEIKEFISIEDYNLFLKGENKIASKRIGSDSPPNIRREIWIEVGMGKNSNDKTDYENIKYGLSSDEQMNGFKLVKEYKVLNLFKRI